MPQYYVGARSHNGTYYDFQANPTWVPSNNVSFVSVQGQGVTGFDATRDLVYQYSQSQSGWTGLFCCLAIIAIFATGFAIAAELLSADVLQLAAVDNLTAATIGASIGAVGGLVATGGNITTNSTASISPFVDSSYNLSPAINYAGDQRIVQQNTDTQWLSVDMANTPGGFQTVVDALDLRKALACGGPSGNCIAPIVSEIGMDNPQFQQIINSMFRQPSKILENNIYPFSAE